MLKVTIHFNGEDHKAVDPNMLPLPTPSCWRSQYSSLSNTTMFQVPIHSSLHQSNIKMLNIVGPNMLPSPTPYCWMSQYSSLFNTTMFNIVGPNMLPSPTPYCWMSQYTSLSNTHMLNIVGPNMLPSPTPYFVDCPSTLPTPTQMLNIVHRSQNASFPNTLFLNILVHFPLQHLNIEDPNTISF